MCYNDSVINISHLTCGDSFMQGVNSNAGLTDNNKSTAELIQSLTSQEM